MRLSRLLFVLVCSAFTADAGQVLISVMATTDLHGNIDPVDYYTDLPAARGLAKIASLVRDVRAENPNNLLIDCGDTIEGSPLESVYQTMVATGKPPLALAPPSPPLDGDPMMLVMNRLGYAAMTVGNHEFNFGLRNLQKARQTAAFPWISANIHSERSGQQRPFAPYVVKLVGGVKVAVIGVTTPSVPTWEKPENVGPYRFEGAVAAIERTIATLSRKERPDLILVAAHGGLGRDLKTGTPLGPEENQVYEIATRVPRLDAIVFGHSHQELPDTRVGDVLLIQPKNGGASLARMDFVLEGGPGAWKLVRKEGRLLRVRQDTPADPEIIRIAEPYHAFAQRYLNTRVAEAPRSLDGRLGRIEDSALVDAIHLVQLHYTKADVSFASLFHPRVRVPQGAVTVRQIAALYIYDNELYAIEGTGQMVKDALENAARYFVSCQGERCSEPPLINPQVFGFNYDTAQGVNYEVDLTRPEGDRIRNLTWKRRPLSAEQKLLIALNNYRAAGSAGYGMFAHAKVLWRSGESIRDLMVQYYTKHRALPSAPDGNWRIIPERARQTLEMQALEEAKRVTLF